MAKNLETPVERVIRHFGTLGATGEGIGGLTPQAIMKWRKTGKVPPARVLDVERATGISRHELRPDIFGGAQ